MRTSRDRAFTSVAVMAFTGLAGYILALVEHALVAKTFGASAQTDAYFVAAIIPTLIDSIVFSSAIGAAFVPVFVGTYARDRGAAMRLANSVLNLILVTGAVLSGVGIVLSGWLVRLTGPGLDAGAQELASRLLAVMFPVLILMALSALLKAFLQAHHHFEVPAFQNVVVPGTIALSVIFLSEDLGIHSVAAGVLAGWAVSLILLLPIVRRKGFRYKPVIDLRHVGVREMGKLLPPVIVGAVTTTVVTMTDRIMSSFLEEGSVAVLSYALKVGDVPSRLFGVALAAVAFPVLAVNVAGGEKEKVKENFSLGVRLSMLVNVPAAVGLVVLARPAVQFFFERGAFTKEAGMATAWTLAFYSLGIPVRGVRAIVIQTFWALKDTRTPMMIGFLNIGYNVVFNFALMFVLGVAGIALSTTLVNTVFLASLVWKLRGRLGSVRGSQIVRNSARILLASAVMGAVTFLAWWFSVRVLALDGEKGRAVNLFLPFAVGVVSYIAAVFALRVEEARLAVDLCLRKLRKRA